MEYPIKINTVEVRATLAIWFLFITDHTIPAKTAITNNAVPVTPICPAAILGRPLIIPLWMMKNTIAVRPTKIPKEDHSNLYFRKYIIRAMKGSVNRFNRCSPVASPII